MRNIVPARDHFTSLWHFPSQIHLLQCQQGDLSKILSQLCHSTPWNPFLAFQVPTGWIPNSLTWSMCPTVSGSCTPSSFTFCILFDTELLVVSEHTDHVLLSCFCSHYSSAWEVFFHPPPPPFWYSSHPLRKASSPASLGNLHSSNLPASQTLSGRLQDLLGPRNLYFSLYLN